MSPLNDTQSYICTKLDVLTIITREVARAKDSR